MQDLRKLRVLSYLCAEGIVAEDGGWKNPSELAHAVAGDCEDAEPFREAISEMAADPDSTLDTAETVFGREMVAAKQCACDALEQV